MDRSWVTRQAYYQGSAVAVRMPGGRVTAYRRTAMGGAQEFSVACWLLAKWAQVPHGARVLVLGAGAFLGLRRLARPGEAPRGRFQVPEQVNPFTVLGVLREIQTRNGLSPDAAIELELSGDGRPLRLVEAEERTRAQEHGHEEQKRHRRRQEEPRAAPGCGRPPPGPRSPVPGNRTHMIWIAADVAIA